MDMVNTMDEQITLEAIESMIERLTDFQSEQPQPVRLPKPVKEINQTYAEYGQLMDDWETMVSTHRERIKDHRLQEWEMEKDIREAIKIYTGLSKHPKCNEIWDYITNNFDGMGYKELLFHTEELLDIFGIK